MMKNQKGLSLIELMIALVISLILSAALITTFMSERVAFDNQKNLSALQENQLMTLNRINDVVNAASFFSDIMNTTLAAALPAKTISGVGSFAAGQGILGISDSSFSIRYQLQDQYKNSSDVVVQKNNNIQDCLGNKSSDIPAILVTNIFKFDATTGQITCTSINETNNTQQTSIISDGINAMTITYGYDSTGNGSVTRYYTYNAITDWTSVKSVMISFTFKNPYDSSTTLPSINAIFTMNNKVK